MINFLCKKTEDISWFSWWTVENMNEFVDGLCLKILEVFMRYLAAAQQVVLCAPAIKRAIIDFDRQASGPSRAKGSTIHLL